MTASLDIDRRLSPNGWSRVVHAISILGGVGALAMMVHITADVVMKLLFNAPLYGTMEITSYYYMVAVVFLPLAYVDWAREAITADLLFTLMPDWLKVVSVLITMVGMLFSYGGLTLLSISDAFAFMARNEMAMGSGYVPIWPARFILSLGLAGATLNCAWQLILFVTRRDFASWLSDEIKIEE